MTTTIRLKPILGLSWWDRPPCRSRRAHRTGTEAGPTVLLLSFLAACRPSSTDTPAVPELPALTSQQAGAIVEEIYSLVADAPVRVLRVMPEQSIFRVTFALPNGAEQTVAITREGSYLAEQVQDTRFHKERLLAARQFVECLQKQNIRVFVDSRAPETTPLVESVGMPFARRITIDCAAAPQNCEKLGVKALPAVAVGNELVTGEPFSRAWLETRTGCK